MVKRTWAGLAVGALALCSGALGNFGEKQTSVILAGDVMLGRAVMTKSLDLNNPNYPFELIKNELGEADLAFVNLENPVVEDCPRRTDGMVFCARPEMLGGLKNAGIDVVNLANNHTKNYGEKGFGETLAHLEEAGVEATGVENLVIKEVNGVKFGFLGFNLVNRKLGEGDLRLVSESDKKADILIVGVHWGAEYKTAAFEVQKLAAKSLLMAGADVVAGHHPHVVQDMEYIDGRPVYYSLGNLVFDQMWSEATRNGLMIKLVFEGKKLVSEKEIPVYMKEWARPEVVRN